MHFYVNKNLGPSLSIPYFPMIHGMVPMVRNLRHEPPMDFHDEVWIRSGVSNLPSFENQIADRHYCACPLARLTVQLESNLTGVCYILDDPTIGLHLADPRSLINVLLALLDEGETVPEVSVAGEQGVCTPSGYNR